MSTYRVSFWNPTTAKLSVTQVERETMEEAVSFVQSTHHPYFKLLKVDYLNEYKVWETKLQVAHTPVEGRMETGPLKVNDDWCGYFFRGDNAITLAMEASEIEQWFNQLPEEHKKDVYMYMSNFLSSIKEMSACRSN